MTKKVLIKNLTTEWPRDNTKWNVETRRRYIKMLALDIGLYNINKAELAKKFGVSRTQVLYDERALVKGGLDKDELQFSTMVISNSIKKASKELHSIIVRSSDDKDKIAAINSLMKVVESHTDFLEKFGLKDIQTPTSETEIIVKWGREDDKRKE